jgi:hypothetical protein
MNLHDILQLCEILLQVSAVGFFLGMSLDLVLFIGLKMYMNGDRKKHTIKFLTRTRPAFQFVANL